MIQLPNGCYCSEPSVSPKNWNKPGASTARPWRVFYRFYDPTITENGKVKAHFVEVKAGMNAFKSLAERRAACKKLLEDETTDLTDRGYHPILKRCLGEKGHDIEYIIHPTTAFISALKAALARLDVTERTRKDIGYKIALVEQAAIQLRYMGLSIEHVSRKHIKVLLAHIWRMKEMREETWSATSNNTTRAYLLMLFKELVELEAAPANPVRDVSRMKVLKKRRIVLTLEQRHAIEQRLSSPPRWRNKEDNESVRRFHKYLHLFFHSGGRGAELLQLRACDVDLQRQVYTTVIRKGRRPREVARTIKNVALEFWQFFLEGCAPDQYLFGTGFRPGSKPMGANVPGDWWRRLVRKPVEKGGLGIDVDFYALKHLNATETTARVGDAAAAEQMGHQGTGMLVGVYDVDRESRQHKRLLLVDNSFAPAT